MIHKITIPPAGETRQEEITGRSINVFEAPIYPSVDDIPYFDFIPGRKQKLITPKSQYPNSEKYTSIEIYGTAASAGDQVVLESTDVCVQYSMNMAFGQTKLVEVNDTVEVDVNSLFEFANRHKYLNGSLARNAELYISNADLLITFGGASPDNSTNFGKRIFAGEHYTIQGQSRIDTFKAINADPATTTILTFEMDF